MPRLKKYVYKLRQNAALASRAVRVSQPPVAAASPASLPSPTSLPSPASSTSSEFRKSLIEMEYKQEGIHKVVSMIDENTVTQLVRNMACPTCFREEVDVKFTRHQVDTYLIAKCVCGHVVLDTLKDKKVKEKSFYPMTLS